MTRRDLGQLTDTEWDSLQSIVDRFERAWQQANTPERTVELSTFLPSPGDPLRALALHELIKSELEIRGRRRQGVSLDYYVERFPELGRLADIVPELIYEEYRVRKRFGDKPELLEYEKRYPAQFPEFERLLKTEPVVPVTVTRFSGPTTLPPAAEKLDITRGRLVPSGTYELSDRIRRGAFGEVWRAVAPGGVNVAIKIIFGSVAENQAQRELQSLELLKRLRHPFLVPVHAYWQLHDRLLIVMELADASLQDRLEQSREAGTIGVPPAELLQYFREAADAIDYLHSKGVLHRDIKPGNILLVENHAKVADFDLIRVVEQTRKLSSASDSGTPAYNAPEVFWRGKVGANSDQYSLAVTYAELRLGRPLFPGTGWLQLMNDHLKRTPDLVPLLEPEQMVLRRALAKEPDERFSSCREFVQALEKAAPR